VIWGSHAEITGPIDRTGHQAIMLDGRYHRESAAW